MLDLMKSNHASRLTLGTAQLGSNYGIANKTGMPKKKKSLKIIEYAISHGINSLDTASGYGNSEMLIGEYIECQRLKNTGKVPSVITKVPSVWPNNFLTLNERHQFIEQTILNSLSRMRISQLDSCLLHDPLDMITNNGEIIKYMMQFKEKEIVKKIGVSVYEPQEVEIAIELECFDIIQVPINILDQRLIQKNLLRKLSTANIEIQGRSIYLQGLILMNPNELPENLQGAKIFLEKLDSMAKSEGLDLMEMALLYVRDIPEVSKIIIGCETIKQLKQNLRIINLPPLTKEVASEIKDFFQFVPNEIIDPRKWN
ncbi:aldo/keto reductase [Priestia aryabhattai]|uniref:aldo/keto reductase n=1 Tax=Priestia aryabhattai TaxID=412384 RepID=UPI0008DE58AE|nr:aldo/keto reductase [Priestia aryabhattai]OHY73445.1 oxidoreductase [Priestia aryabhattai]